MLFHKKTFIFAPENEMWKDLSSLQPQKKMLKQHSLLYAGWHSPTHPVFSHLIFNFQFSTFNF